MNHSRSFQVYRDPGTEPSSGAVLGLVPDEIGPGPRLHPKPISPYSLSSGYGELAGLFLQVKNTVLADMWDLSSPARIEPTSPALDGGCNHWTTN